MKVNRYIITLLFGAAVVVLYHYVDIRLFEIDFVHRTHDKLFFLRSAPPLDPSIVLINTGTATAEEIGSVVDSLLTMPNIRIGIDPCQVQDTHGYLNRFADVPRVVLAGCGDEGGHPLSRIVEGDNSVLFFRADDPGSFEQSMTGWPGRGNEEERINYLSPGYGETFYKSELEFVPFVVMQGADQLEFVLLGYMGDYLTDSIYDYSRTRITPVNPYYGYGDILPDMYDLEISANIIHEIRDGTFFTELPLIGRIAILLTITLLSVVLLTVVRTRWLIVNLIWALLVFVLLQLLATYSMVMLFNDGIYLVLDELTLMLLIAMPFTFLLNLNDSRKKTAEADNQAQ